MVVSTYVFLQIVLHLYGCLRKVALCRFTYLYVVDELPILCRRGTYQGHELVGGTAVLSCQALRIEL